jgi:hypothetical protein
MPKPPRKPPTIKELENPTPLTGKSLLHKVKQLGNVSRRETAKACGYYRFADDGQIRINLNEFYDALLDAKGVTLSPEGAKDGRGKTATYKASVQKNGQLVIGAHYTQAMGLKAGDEFEIKLGYKHIHLVKIELDENGDDRFDSDDE